MPDPYDFLVIGGGSAGYAAARTAVDLGLRTAVVDGAETLGGLCILRGCMPSKSLIESANRNISLRRAAEFGLRAGNLSVLPGEIRNRKRRLIDDFAGYRQGQLADGRFALHRGTATFLDARTLRVTPRDGGAPTEISARAILVATGSSISVPDIPGLADAGFLTSDDVLDADTIPTSVIVLGGGAIALEMAHFYEGVGAKVAVVQRSPHVLKEFDADVSDSLTHAFRARGIEVYTGTELLHAGIADNGEKTITFHQGGGTVTLAADAILVALGRHPATQGLGLGNAGVQLQGGRITTDRHQATSVPHLFAAGDVCGPHEVVHTAIEQGECAATNAAVLLGKLPASRMRAMDYRLKLLGIFTEPQVACVGLTEKEAAAEGLAIETATYPFDDHGKSMVRGETEGFVKLIARQDSGELVGAAVVGPEGVELIHEIVVALHFRATAADLAKIPHYHPTLSEIWTYPAEEIAEKMKSSPRSRHFRLWMRNNWWNREETEVDRLADQAEQELVEAKAQCARSGHDETSRERLWSTFHRWIAHPSFENGGNSLNCRVLNELQFSYADAETKEEAWNLIRDLAAGWETEANDNLKEVIRTCTFEIFVEGVDTPELERLFSLATDPLTRWAVFAAYENYPWRLRPDALEFSGGSITDADCDQWLVSQDLGHDELLMRHLGTDSPRQ